MTIDPVVYAATLVATVLATLIGQFLLAKFRHRERMLEIEHENRRLEAKLADQETTFERMISDLKEQHIKEISDRDARLATYENRDALFADCHFDENTGTWINESSEHFCTRCREETPSKKSRMQNVEIDHSVGLYAYRCTMCLWDTIHARG